MDPKTSVLLNSGYYMPIIGIGMFQTSEEDDLDTMINTAIDEGYRHIDTAFLYMTEHFLGNILQRMFKAGKIKREELFIVSKLPSNGMHHDSVEEFFMTSLRDLQLDYMDLYLIHSPIAAKRQKSDKDCFPIKNGSLDVDHSVDLVQTWKAMEKLVEKGLVRSIGLSNFNSRQIQRIYDAASIKPANLQVECHVYLPQYELQEFCNRLNISFTAYAPLGAPYNKFCSFKTSEPNEVSLLQDPRLTPLCKKYKKTPAQIVLRYLIERDIIVIPKSTNPQRIKENFDVFDFRLSNVDMQILKSMGCKRRYFGYAALKGMYDLPEFPFKIPY